MESAQLSDNEEGGEIHEVPESQATQSQSKKGKGKRRKKTRPDPIPGPVEVAVDMGQDELDLYLSERPVSLQQYKDDPLLWWRDHGQRRFPKLSYMASDILTIPSSTAETERQFNSAGTMITSSRNHLNRAFVGQCQSMASWSNQGIYRPELPIHILQNKCWWEGLQEVGYTAPVPDGIQVVR